MTTLDPIEELLIERHAQFIELATSSASLDRSPKKNWVENTGNLPPYIRKIARAVERTGKPLSSAIAIAISRVKRWAAGGDNVTAKTRAKAAKAVAQWEALKAKAGGKKVALTMTGVAISEVSDVKEAILEREWLKQSNPTLRSDILEFTPDQLLIQQSDPLDGSSALYTVAYLYDSGFVSFSDPVFVDEVDDEDDDTTPEEIELLNDLLGNTNE